MLSDNIRNLRKNNYMSQDELAEKLGVSRQSVSLWENGQTQPTIDNIVAMAKIFNVSSDVLLESSENAEVVQIMNFKNKKTTVPIISIAVAAVVIIAAVTVLVIVKGKNSEKTVSDNDSVSAAVVQSENSDVDSEPSESVSTGGNETENSVKSESTNRSESTNKTGTVSKTDKNKDTSGKEAYTEKQFDLFEYCKNFAIKKGTLNGDYCIYQQTSSKYGGRSNEYFSITYWSDSNMVEFCLHCPLNETYSENFYLRMRGGYNKKYEYLSSLYYRDNGESVRSATGYIDPAVFSANYPISCDRYDGAADKQNDFMEESRVGICDLICCLKEFVTVENMECGFSAFDFVNF